MNNHLPIHDTSVDLLIPVKEIVFFFQFTKLEGHQLNQIHKQWLKQTYRKQTFRPPL